MTSIIERISPVFAKNYPLEKRDVVWNSIMTTAAIIPLDELNLDNMGSTDLVRGYGGGHGKKEIIKLAEALGVCGISNPENDAHFGKHMAPPVNVEGLTPDEILDKIQAVLPFPINFPTFNGNLPASLSTKYGVTSNRHIYYLWVLKRVMELCPDKESGIIEIGAGFGMLGYYLDKAGYRDYTVIDLALVNACQTYFLSKNLPDRNIILSGDVENPFDIKHKDSIKLLHSTDFKDAPQNRFSLMVNMDGLTEYGVAAATQYVQHDCAPTLLSINHEMNEFRVIDLKQPNRKLKSRYTFWLRDGWVEELYQKTL